MSPTMFLIKATLLATITKNKVANPNKEQYHNYSYYFVSFSWDKVKFLGWLLLYIDSTTHLVALSTKKVDKLNYYRMSFYLSWTKRKQVVNVGVDDDMSYPWYSFGKVIRILLLQVDTIQLRLRGHKNSNFLTGPSYKSVLKR